MEQSIQELEQQLFLANERLKNSMAAFSQSASVVDRDEEYEVANQLVLQAERQLAAAKGEPYAETISFPLSWDIGAPMPHLVVSDDRAILAFLLNEPDPNWDGTYATIKDPAARTPEPLGLVEFNDCVSAKLGAPNEDLIHPLEGHGREPYRAQRVINSPWIRELHAMCDENTNEYLCDRYGELEHFIFWFHDSTFECLAPTYVVEEHRISMRDLLVIMVDRLIQ